ncbi:MAG: protein kinase [Planctomycetota bacterium]
MEDPHYHALHELFERARQVSGEPREALLGAADPALAREVRGLLDAAEGAERDDAIAEAAIARQRALVGELASAAGTPAHPKQVGPYRIGELLGVGGMGLVYAAEQLSPRRKVALKVLHPTAITAEKHARFKREAELLGRLQHAGIAQIYEAGSCDLGHGSQPYFAMELIRGANVVVYANQARLDTRGRLALVARIADAIEHAHQQGVVHRDLKPDNVLVDGAGQPKVLDFGVARPIDALDSLALTVTREGQIFGTLAYMSPEQCIGGAAAVDVRCDVYALGVILYELLTGRTPLRTDGLTVTRAMHYLANVDPPRPSELDPRLAGDVETIALKALEKDPLRRYARAKDLADDLRRALAHEPILARPPSRAYRARKFVRRHKGLTGTLTALLIGIIGTSTFAARSFRLSNETRAANERLARALYGAETRLASLAATEPGGLEQLRRYTERWSDAEVPAGTRGFEFDLMQALSAPEGLAVELPQRVMAGEVSPDGAYIALATKFAAEVRDARTLAPVVRLGEPGGRFVFDIDWSPDGTRVATTDEVRGLAVWDAATGAEQWRDPERLTDANGVEWAPSGDGIVTTSFQGVLRVHDAATGALRVRVERACQGDAKVLSMDGRGNIVVADQRGRVVRYPWPIDAATAAQVAGPAPGSFNALALNADGRRLACADLNGNVTVVRLDSAPDAPERTRTRHVHAERITALAWSTDDTLLAASSWDNSVSLLEAANLQPQRRFRPSPSRQEFVCFTRGDTALFMGGYAPLLLRASLERSSPFQRRWARPGSDTTDHAVLALRPNSDELLTMHGTLVTKWRLPRATGLLEFVETSERRAGVIAVAPDGLTVASANDNEIELRSAEDDRVLANWRTPASPIWGLAFAPDRAARVYAYARGLLLAYEVGVEEPVAVLDLGRPVLAMEALTRGRVAVGGSNLPLTLVDTRQLEPGGADPGGAAATRVCAAAANPTSIRVSPDGTRLAVGLDSYDVLVVRLPGLEVEHDLLGHTGTVFGVAWSPDGARIASAGGDGRVLLWDARDGGLVALLDQESPAGKLEFTPDGRQLIVATHSGSVTVWTAGS